MTPFFSELRLNNEPDDSWGEIEMNQNSQEKLASIFAEFTMKKIAEKNPFGGNAEGLRQAARNIVFR